MGLGLNPDPNGIGQGLRLEQQALTLDDSLAFAHCVMAGIDATIEQYDEAGLEAQRAIALDPNSALGYEALAEILNTRVRPAEALVAFEDAMRLDPRNPDNYIGDQGWSYMELGAVERIDSGSQA